MKLGILSDSHDNRDAVVGALRAFDEDGVERIVHCGDITSPSTLELFAGRSVSFVLGNNDDARLLEPVAADLGFGAIEELLVLDLAGLKTAMYHGTVSSKLRSLIASNKYDLVLHGHTHVRRDERIGTTRIINPGALHRAKQYTVATLVCETGLVTWHDVPR